MEYRFEDGYITGPCRIETTNVAVEIPNPDFMRPVKVPVRNGGSQNRKRTSKHNQDERGLEQDDYRQINEYFDENGNSRNVYFGVKRDERRFLTTYKEETRLSPLEIVIHIAADKIAPDLHAPHNEQKVLAFANQIGAGEIISRLNNKNISDTERSNDWQKLNFKWQKYDHPIYDEAIQDSMRSVADQIENTLKASMDAANTADHQALKM